MELLQLQYFKKVAETGKISAAAQQLFISPPALSATIARLEKELGTPLFDRTGNSIRLNKQGEIFLKYSSEALQNLENGKEEVRSSLKAAEPHVRVALTSANLWIGLLSAFSLEHPEITLSNTTLKLSQVAEGGIPSKYSFLLAEENDLPTGPYEKLPLITGDHPVLMVHPDHPLAKKESVNLREIKDETFFLPVADMSLTKMMQELLSMAEIHDSRIYEYSYLLRRRMISENRGVSFSTVYTSQSEEPGFRYIPIEEPRCEFRHCIFWRAERPLNRYEKTFLDFAEAYFIR